MKIIARKEAAKVGLNKFYTGKACRHGHIAERYVCNGVCTKCGEMNTRHYREGIKQLLSNNK